MLPPAGDRIPRLPSSAAPLRHRKPRLETILGSLPDITDLAPLREALIGASRGSVGAASGETDAQGALDTRVVEATELGAEVGRIADRVRERTERVLRHALAAAIAVGAGRMADAARELVAAGEVEEGERRFAEAEAFYSRALELGRKPRDRSAEALALRRLARVARWRGELERAAELYERALEVSEAMREAEGVVVACTGRGNVCVDQGRWREAGEWYERGLALLDGSPPGRTYGELLSNMAIVARRMERWDESSRWLDRAEEMAGTLGDPSLAALVRNGRGRLLLARGKLAEAEAEFAGAWRDAAELRTRLSFRLNHAEAVRLQDRPGEAERIYREVEGIAVAHGATFLLPEVYRGLGAVAAARSDEDGFVFYEQALDLVRARGLPQLQIAETQVEYARFERAVGREGAALARLAEAREIYAGLGAEMELRQLQAQIMELVPPDESETNGEAPDE